MFFHLSNSFEGIWVFSFSHLNDTTFNQIHKAKSQNLRNKNQKFDGSKNFVNFR